MYVTTTYNRDFQIVEVIRHNLLKYFVVNMSWISIIKEEKATGELKKTYNKIKKKRGKIANIMKIHSLNPDAMEIHMDLYLTLMFGSSGLSRKTRELIAVVVSVINRCDYCVNHHAEALNYYWKNDEKIKNLINNVKILNLTEKEKNMIEYVHKLTKTPYDIEKIDVDNLRKYGFSDKDILNINLLTCYFNFVNRIALGLGVEFSKDETTGYKY